MPANPVAGATTNRSYAKNPFNQLLADYLGNDEVGQEAYLVAVTFFNYLSLYNLGSSGFEVNKLMQDKTPDLYNVALWSPIFGFAGNRFWQRYQSEFLSTVSLDVINTLSVRRMIEDGIQQGGACLSLFSFQCLSSVVWCKTQSIDLTVDFTAQYRSLIVSGAAKHGT